MQKSFDFITDPGHGWVKVPFDLLQTLGITTNISHYSYMRGEYAYLEEDRDASLFHQAFEKHYGTPPQYRMRVAGQKYSRVRNYDTYNAFNKYFLEPEDTYDEFGVNTKNSFNTPERKNDAI